MFIAHDGRFLPTGTSPPDGGPDHGGSKNRSHDPAV